MARSSRSRKRATPAPERIPALAARVVVAIGDEELRRTIAALLRACDGSRVDSTSTGEEALELLEQGPCDAVLLDAELASRIEDVRARATDVPVLVLAEDPDAPSPAGATDSLPTQDLDSTRLVRAIKAAQRVARAETIARLAHGAREAQAKRLAEIVGAALDLQGADRLEQAVSIAVQAIARLAGGPAALEVETDDEVVARAVGTPPANAPTVALPFARGAATGHVRVIAEDDAQLVLTQLLRVAALSIENLILRSRAERAAKSRQDLVAIVSHDLRGPLQTFALGIKLMGSARELDALPPTLARMTRNVASMERLIHDILDVARLEDDAFKLVPASIDPTRLVREVIDELAPQAEHAQVGLTSETVTDRRLFADPTRMRQALGNLVANAIRHTPGEGRIAVRAREDDGHVRFEVADTGPGVPQELRARIFDRLVRGDSGKTLGVGLGLYIARCIAEAHGGSVGVDSESGRGSTFWIRIPSP